jgi:hypothetical protein
VEPAAKIRDPGQSGRPVCPIRLGAEFFGRRAGRVKTSARAPLFQTGQKKRPGQGRYMVKTRQQTGGGDEIFQADHAHSVPAPDKVGDGGPTLQDIPESGQIHKQYVHQNYLQKFNPFAAPRSHARAAAPAESARDNPLE